MTKIKRTATATLEYTFNTGLTAGDVLEFIKDIPTNAKLSLTPPKSYPGEPGEYPGTITASWEEERSSTARAED